LQDTLRSEKKLLNLLLLKTRVGLHLLPHAQDTLVSLSSELPFRWAVAHLERTLGVVVHASTARRQTLAVGQRMLEGQDQQAQPLAACPEEPAAERLVMSSDGSMVPVVGGVWAEVKVVAIGAVERRRRKDEEQIVTSDLTYFARMAPAATFADQGSRRTAQAGDRASHRGVCHSGWSGVDPGVCARPSFQCGAYSRRGPMQPAISMSLQRKCAKLEGICLLDGKMASCIGSRHEGPTRVLRHLTRLARRAPQIQEQVTYLQKRRDLMEYPTYRASGWPIGSWRVWSGVRSSWCKPGSKDQACIGNPHPSIPCSHCAWHCSMRAGWRPGRSNTACVGTSSTSRARFVNSSVCVSSRPYGSSRNHLSSPFPRHPSQHDRRLVALRLSIAGEGNPFPPACSSKQPAQKNEPHTRKPVNRLYHITAQDRTDGLGEEKRGHLTFTCAPGRLFSSMRVCPLV